MRLPNNMTIILVIFRALYQIITLVVRRHRKLRNYRFNANEVELVDDKAAFDVVRAAVNLVIASMLITFGTNHKLPLSTTYVTFMVAMGSSLADRA